MKHVRFPCPSLSPRVCSNSCPLSQWCHLTISSSITPFSPCPQSFPASGAFPDAFHIRWVKRWSPSFSISPANECSGLTELDYAGLNLYKLWEFWLTFMPWIFNCRQNQERSYSLLHTQTALFSVCSIGWIIPQVDHKLGLQMVEILWKTWVEKLQNRGHVISKLCWVQELEMEWSCQGSARKLGSRRRYPDRWFLVFLIPFLWCRRLIQHCLGVHFRRDQSQLSPAIEKGPGSLPYWGCFVLEILVDFSNWPFGLLVLLLSLCFKISLLRFKFPNKEQARKP